MTPAKIEINERNQAAVSSRRGHINLPRLLKINDAKGKHLDNELYNDGWYPELAVESQGSLLSGPDRNANISERDIRELQCVLKCSYLFIYWQTVRVSVGLWLSPTF